MAARNKSWLEQHVRVSSKRHKSIALDDRLNFLKQISTLLNAGTPLLDSLRMSAQQSLSSKLKTVLDNIAGQVAAGTSFHKACAAHPKVFQPHWVQIIAVGEMTGEMGSVLHQLCLQAQKTEKNRSKMVSAMVYPCIMTIVAVLCVVIMLWKVVPTFAQFFDDFGAELPGVTQMVLDLSDFIRTRGLYILIGLAAVVFALRHWMRRESGMRMVNLLSMAMPVIGELVVQNCMVKFGDNLALLLRSGIPLLDALGALKGVMYRNVLYRQAIEHVERRVSSGGTLAASLGETGVFPSMVVGMVSVGEDSGNLPQVLQEVGSYYGEKVDVALQRVMSMVEPMVIIGMGVTVGVIMAAIYLPMFQLSAAAG